MQRALRTFATGQRVIVAGHQLPDSDPLVEAHSDLFEDVPEAPKRQARRKKAPDADGDS